MREVFLEELPNKTGFGNNANKTIIDWKSSIGHVANFIYDDIEGEFKIIDYDVKKQKVSIVYKSNKYCIATSQLIVASLGGILKKHTSAFKINIGEILKNSKRDFFIIERERRDSIGKNNTIKKNKWYKYRCNKCGFEGWIAEGHLLNNRGCSCCSSSPKVVKANINSIVAKEETHWMIKYFQGGYEEAKKYTPNSNKSVYFKCPDCGEIKSKKKKISSFYKNKSIGCSCGDGISYPEKLMYYLLRQLKIDFVKEYSPEWIKPRRYDFYIPSLNLIIEMDGELGHGNKAHSKSNLTKEDSIEVDIYKSKKAIENGIKLIRIDCFRAELDYIKNNIINSELSNLIDFSKVNWTLCERNSLPNIIKEVSEYWNNKEEYETTTDLARAFNIWAATIVSYLKKGNKVGWCNYNPKEELDKTLFKKGSVVKSICKRIAVCKDGKELKQYISLNEMQRKSKDDFGIIINRSDVKSVVEGNRESIKGYTFKYLDEDIEYKKYVPKSNKYKKVEVFKDGVSLGIYYSVMELREEFETKFGIKLKDSKIRESARENKIYNGYEFKYVGNLHFGKNNSKRVEIFKDYISLGIFESTAELAKNSEELFGVKLLASSISVVANGKLKQYKGFTFKYVDEN